MFIMIYFLYFLIFKEYFIKQWLTSPFNNWQIFNTQTEYATTNNPEESFNKQFKLIYTENERVTMGPMCDVMYECVHDYSSTKVNTAFALVATRDNAIIKDAKNLYAPFNFVLLNNYTVQYKDNF